MEDPISHQMYIKQLEKIKNRENLYLPKENSIKKELKELNEKIIKLEKEIKDNDRIIKNIKSKKNNKINKNNEFVSEVIKIQNEQLKKVIQQNKILKNELREAKKKQNLYSQ